MVRAASHSVVHTSCSVRGSEIGGQTAITAGKCRDHCGEARPTATAPGHYAGYCRDYCGGRYRHQEPRQQAILQKVDSLHRLSRLPPCPLFRLFSRLFPRLPRLSFRPSIRLHSVHGRHGGHRPRMDVALQLEGNENGQALVEQLSLATNQPYRINFDLAILRKMRYSPCFHGFGLYGSIHAFLAICARRIWQQKHLFFNLFSLCVHAQASPSIIKHSTTNNSLSHPRCRTLAVVPSLSQWPCGHGLFPFLGAF